MNTKVRARRELASRERDEQYHNMLRVFIGSSQILRRSPVHHRLAPAVAHGCGALRHLCARPAQATATEDAATPSFSGTDDDEPVRLYRFAHITALRALLRMKAIQMVAGVGVVLPAVTVLSTGSMPTLADGAAIATTAVATVAVAGSLSWYCERIVGEASWRPISRTLRISTLTMWGERRDADFSAAELVGDDFFEVPPTLPDFVEVDLYPTSSLVPFELCGKTYVFAWGPRHVVAPDALADLLVRNSLPQLVSQSHESVVRGEDGGRGSSSSSSSDRSSRGDAVS